VIRSDPPVTHTASFGDLLRRYRRGAGLTQEALAEHSGLSARAISDLERGLRTAPRRETVRLLSDALRLEADPRIELESAARRLQGEPLGQKAAAVLLPRLVGRTREFEMLRAKLQAAQVASGGLVLLSGEPGIGKTRLLEELALEAQQRQMLVLWGRCWENAGAPPFWPWAEVFRGLIRSRASGLLQAELGTDAAFIAQLVPEVHDHLSNLPAPSIVEPAEARFRLFHAITIALQNVAGAQPLLLVLDDLHWADKPSVLLLEFLLPYIASSRLLIVGAYRDTDMHDRPLAETLGALRRDRSFEVLALDGLSAGAVRELVGGWLDPPVAARASGQDLALALWQATEGNPLFVCEALRYLREEDRLPLVADGRSAIPWLAGVALPQGVRDVIGRRLSRLSQATINVLMLASVIGREFDPVVLQGSGEVDDAGMDAALDEAQLASVVEETGRSSARYRFTHALFREALYADLPARRRRRLHRQVAEALERTYARDLDLHLSELAYHFGAAQPVSGNHQLAHYALLAGERSLDTKAYEEAVVQFERGLQTTVGQPMDAQQAALLFGLGRAQAATVELPRAGEVVANLTRAFEYYARQGDVERAVAVAECPVDALPGQPVGAARLIASALALVDRDTHAAGRLLGRYARMVAIEAGDYPIAAEACEQALAIARREGDVRLEIQTLGNGAEADVNYLHWEQGLRKCLRGVELAEHTDAVQAEMLPRFFASIVAWQMGDLARASEQAAVLLRRAELLRDRRWWVNALWIAGTLARYTGAWPAARELLDRAASLSPADPRVLWTRITLEHDAGDDIQVRALVATLLEVVPLTPPEPNLAQASTALILAIVAGADAGVSEASLRLAEAASEAMLASSTATPIVLRFARASLAVLAVRRGDAAAAQRHYPALEAARGTFIYETMPGDRLLGLLAATTGKYAAALRHFEAALSFCRRNGCDHELAWTSYDLVRLLRERQELDGADRVSDLLDTALGIARDLGMQRLLGLGSAMRAEKTARQS